jgi:hypothetical protein
MHETRAFGVKPATRLPRDHEHGLLALLIHRSLFRFISAHKGNTPRLNLMAGYCLYSVQPLILGVFLCDQGSFPSSRSLLLLAPMSSADNRLKGPKSLIPQIMSVPHFLPHVTDICFPSDRQAASRQLTHVQISATRSSLECSQDLVVG